MGNIKRYNNKLKWIAVIIACFAITGNAYSQCLNQVTHTSGTSTISGVNVTVTSFGSATTNTAYCASTTPYNIGYLTSAGITLNSGYTFQFVPAVDSVTLNFSGISNTAPYQEIVIVEINGVRYSIPSAGNSNGCDAMAMLTPEGYITGCAGCSVSGWNGTTIAGPVSMITVIDSAALNGPGGNQSLFSLFFCNPSNTGIGNNMNIGDGITIYPNPSVDELTITTDNNEPLQITLYDFTSRKLLEKKFTNSVSLNIEHLKRGIYFYEVRCGNTVYKKGKLIKK